MNGSGKKWRDRWRGWLDRQWRLEINIRRGRGPGQLSPREIYLLRIQKEMFMALLDPVNAALANLTTSVQNLAARIAALPPDTSAADQAAAAAAASALAGIQAQVDALLPAAAAAAVPVQTPAPAPAAPKTLE